MKRHYIRGLIASSDGAERYKSTGTQFMPFRWFGRRLAGREVQSPGEAYAKRSELDGKGRPFEIGGQPISELQVSRN